MLIQIVLFDGFDLLDALGPYEVFNAASLMTNGAVDVELVSAEGARMTPSAPGGLRIQATGKPDLERADVILIPGAAGPLSGAGEDCVPAVLARTAAGPIPEIVREALARPGLTVATVCGGSLILGMAGLLNGRPAVTHPMGMELLAASGARAVKARVVDDGNLISGGGVTSGLDVALHLVERELGPRIAHAVETLFEYERRGVVWKAGGLAPIDFALPAAAEVERTGAPAPSIAGTWDVTI